MLTDEANAILRSVRDIDDGEFLDKVQHTKKVKPVAQKKHNIDTLIGNNLSRFLM